MGQYYIYINIDKRIAVNAYYGAELCEHSWLGNNEVVIPIEQLVKTKWQGDRVIQLGDYADGMAASAASTALRKEHLKFIEKIKKEIGMTNDQRLYWGDVAEKGEKFKEYTLEELFDSYDLKLGQKCSCDQFRYLYNTKRKEYVDSFKILPSYAGVPADAGCAKAGGLLRRSERGPPGDRPEEPPVQPHESRLLRPGARQNDPAAEQRVRGHLPHPVSGAHRGLFLVELPLPRPAEQRGVAHRLLHRLPATAAPGKERRYMAGDYRQRPLPGGAGAVRRVRQLSCALALQCPSF